MFEYTNLLLTYSKSRHRGAVAAQQVSIKIVAEPAVACTDLTIILNCNTQTKIIQLL